MTPEEFLPYQTGIPEIDKHHYELFILMHRILRLIDDAQYHEATVLTRELSVLFKEHCFEEDALMIKLSYPHATEHIHGHKRILHLLDDMANDVLCAVNCDGIIAMLTLVIPRHLIEHDLQMAYYMHNKSAYDAYIHNLKS